jgi:hypothetical protein
MDQNGQGAAPALIVPRHMPRPNVCARRCPRDARGKYVSREESLIASSRHGPAVIAPKNARTPKPCANTSPCGARSHRQPRECLAAKLSPRMMMLMMNNARMLPLIMSNDPVMRHARPRPHAASIRRGEQATPWSNVPNRSPRP